MDAVVRERLSNLVILLMLSTTNLYLQDAVLPASTLKKANTAVELDPRIPLGSLIKPPLMPLTKLLQLEKPLTLS
jgi:hypothetical protein